MKRSSTTGVRGSRSIVAVLMACLVAVGMLAIPAPAHAAGGGCEPSNWAPENWRFKACIGDDGLTVGADGWVDAIGDYRGATSCAFIVKLIDVTTPGVNRNIGQARAGCALGRLPVVNAAKVPGKRYVSWVELERKPCCTIIRKVSPVAF